MKNATVSGGFNMEIVKSTDTAYEKYESLLLRRDNLVREAEQYHFEYIREFGDLIQRSFELKIECIRKKKEIAFCQKLANQGKTIKRSDLVQFIENEMEKYHEELKKLVDDVKASKESTKISVRQARMVKETYYRLAKLIHPDLHPELAGDEKLLILWERIMIAYAHNQLAELQELEVVVKAHLKSRGIGPSNVEIPDIEVKIKKVEEEIEKIITTDPYLFKLLLTDPVSREERKQQYLEDIEAYEKYSAQLSKVLDTFEIEEMLS